MRMQRKDSLAAQRPALDLPDRGVSVFHREWKLARHERRAHPVKFAFWDAPVEHQRLRAPADRAIKRVHANFVRVGWSNGFLAQLGLSRSPIPEGRSQFGAFVNGHLARSRPGIAGHLTCYNL